MDILEEFSRKIHSDLRFLLEYVGYELDLLMTLNLDQAFEHLAKYIVNERQKPQVEDLMEIIREKEEYIEKISIELKQSKNELRNRVQVKENGNEEENASAKALKEMESKLKNSEREAGRLRQETEQLRNDKEKQNIERDLWEKKYYLKKILLLFLFLIL